jgi:hypothetical protein
MKMSDEIKNSNDVADADATQAQAELSEKSLNDVAGGVSMGFGKIEVQYKQQKPDGSLGS